MTSERIKEIQEQTAYPESTSVMLALKQVWNECEQEQLVIQRVINWVATEKELPKQTGEILIYVDGLGVRNAIFNITDNSFSFNSVYKPTHWAELPKPPCC